MKVSLNWLRDYVDITLPLNDLAYRLTMSGTEVGETEVIGEAWDKIVVGEIIAVEPHPDADRLALVTVDLGVESATVVCGAPNVRVGDKVPFARLGAQLIDGHTGKLVELKPAQILGVVSEGMACSEKELGISDSHEGLMILPPEAPAGMPLAEYLGDAVLDLEVTPNRADCLSVIGIAREIAGLTRKEIRLVPRRYEEQGPDIGQLASVEIAAPDLCGRYCASLIDGVKIASSPPWMQQRLINCGMRPINNIVDVTNYVMLEYGQPLHAFDFRQIGGGKIVVRRASEGETMTTLDGVDRILTPDTLVIADEEIPVAVAGVMGGADSEVIDITTSVLLESANFNPASIRHTSTALKLRSEASTRFERGISPDITVSALKRATELILESAGGKAAKGIIDVYPGKRDAKQIMLNTAEVKRVLGVEMKLDRIVDILTSLGFKCEVTDASEAMVTVPHWRMDVNLTVDLIEELARIVGYDFIPTTMLGGRLSGRHYDPVVSLREKLRDLMVGCGFQEVISYSLVSKERLSEVAPSGDTVRVANPLSIEQEYLRTSLRQGMVMHLRSNQRHEEDGIRLFEAGRVYFPIAKDLPEEREMLAGVLSGPRTSLSWLGQKELLDFFDAKGVVDILLQRIGVEADFEASKEVGLHPGRAADIVVADEVVGNVGELHPGLVERFELLPQPVALIELDIGKLVLHISDVTKFQSLSRFPQSTRDIAVVVDAGVPVKNVRDIILGFPLVAKVNVFDVYTGDQVPLGKKSLALRVVYQSPTHTLTDAEIEEVEREVLDRLSRELGATLRG